jgi:peptide-methionine (R)-S-oxide reductase
MNTPVVPRRRLLAALAIAPLAALLAFRRGSANAAEPATETIAPLRKTTEEWRKLLEPRRFEVLFEDDTERPNSSPLNAEKRAGTFICAACFLPLFDARDKYESGTGWPSFTRPLPGRMETELDFSMVWPRTEYHCIRCSGHQGHVFDDGPPPTGKRWCNNGLALLFVPEGTDLPGLRT